MQGSRGFTGRFVLLALVIVAMYTKLVPTAIIIPIRGRAMKDER